jgi:hypothetical protein
MDHKEFAAWRKQVGVTQEELAGRWAGVTRATIQNWESGATPIPRAVESACATWKRRLKQENPAIGPVTLIYADGPMFIDPYGPRRRLAMLQQEPYPTNAAVLARVLELWGRDTFHNPFVIEKDGHDLWNGVELQRVVSGDDTGAPTLINLLRRLARHIKETSTTYARSGPKVPTSGEAKRRQQGIEAVGAKIDALADAASHGPIFYQDVEQSLSDLREMGKFAPDSLVSAIAHAFQGRGSSAAMNRPPS